MKLRHAADAVCAWWHDVIVQHRGPRLTVASSLPDTRNGGDLYMLESGTYAAVNVSEAGAPGGFLCAFPRGLGAITLTLGCYTSVSLLLS